MRMREELRTLVFRVLAARCSHHSEVLNVSSVGAVSPIAAASYVHEMRGVRKPDTVLQKCDCLLDEQVSESQLVIKARWLHQLA